MSVKYNYEEKFNKSCGLLPVDRLSSDDFKHLRDCAFHYHLSFQELKTVVEISIDLKMWQSDNLVDILKIHKEPQNPKQLKKKALADLIVHFEELRAKKKNYSAFNSKRDQPPSKIKDIIFKPSDKSSSTIILGKCPVASEKTLCCNLQTLDVVNNCGFECSYCSIQSFFPNNTIIYEDQLVEKLNRLKIDPKKIYHIGTGQSSDSLMWGNKSGILDQLMNFARNNPNVILEFKTKSKNISYFLNNLIPKNIICTWSLNPDVIIENEEHHTATLDERIKAARSLANKGILVGFHLHPIIYYEGYEKDYELMARKLTLSFLANEIAMISMGTLTFTKPVLKEIRKKSIYSKILQMKLEEASGKFSYPENIKIKMFKNVYDSFLPWHKEVFFYLCMEQKSYWPKIFGHEYVDNLDFETKMKTHYMGKIDSM